MKLREKVGNLFMVGFDGTSAPPSLTRLIRDYHIGGVILFKRNIHSKDQLKNLIGEINELSEGRKLLIAVDHEGGRVFRLPSPFTQWEPMAKVNSDDEAYNIGKIMAKELLEVGFNVNFAPVLDVNTNVKNPVIGDRSFSNNPLIVASRGVSLIRGLQENGIIACGKHFPGHGDTSLDSHIDFPVLPHTMGRLEFLELLPFKAAIEAGVKSIMTAHVVYEGVDTGVPATLSETLINKLLREQLKFSGVVFTDDLQMAAIAKKWSLGDACLMSLKAGCDVCLICRDNSAQKEAIEHIVQCANAGKISETAIESACRRIANLFDQFI